MTQRDGTTDDARAGFRARWHAARYAPLTGLLVAMTGLSQLEDERAALVRAAVLALVVVAAVAAVADSRGRLLGAGALGAVQVLALWLAPRGAAREVADALGGLLFAYVAWRLFREVFLRRGAASTRIHAAIAAYVLGIWIFADAYDAVAQHDPEAFAPAALAEGAERRTCMVYFSAVTQTTLGYGDVVPRSGAARGLAIVQSMLGVLYVAVTIARLAGAADAPRRA